jgi:hypothetical protein
VTVLADSAEDGSVVVAERKFNHQKWGTVKNTEVSRLFMEPVKPFFDPREVCSSCLFMRNNQVVKEIMHASQPSGSQIPIRIKHLNFP